MRSRSRSATISGAPNFSIASAMQSLTRSWQELKNMRRSSAARWATDTYDLNSVVALMGSLPPSGLRGCPPIMSGTKMACRAPKTLLRARNCRQNRRKAAVCRENTSCAASAGSRSRNSMPCERQPWSSKQVPGVHCCSGVTACGRSMTGDFAGRMPVRAPLAPLSGFRALSHPLKYRADCAKL